MNLRPPQNANILNSQTQKNCIKKIKTKPKQDVCDTLSQKYFSKK